MNRNWEADIQAALAQGWVIETYHNGTFILPPESDPKRHWCTKWIKVVGYGFVPYYLPERKPDT